MRQKFAVITGASSGIGGAIALELARAGYTIALIGRNQGRLAEIKQKIDAIGGAVRFSRQT